MNSFFKYTRQGGFSLVELMIVIGIVAAIAVMGLPELGYYLRENRLSTQANSFIAAVNYARGQAITRNQEIFISALPENVPARWEQGWQVWIDGYQACDAPAVNGAPDACEILQIFEAKEQALFYGPDNLKTIGFATVTADEDKSRTLSYNGGNGTLNISAPNVSFYLCFENGGHPGRHISINRTGRVRMENRKLDPCPAE